MYPLSNCIPSTTFKFVPKDFDSSTVITPSWPTFSIASAISSPISLLFPAEIAATCAISALVLTGLDIALIFSTAASTALSIPRFIDIGFAPAVKFFKPSRTIAWANTEAVVVQSPATSWVWDDTSFNNCAPEFSKASFNSISFAIVTPSLTIWGAPNFLVKITFLPLGPSVTLTASATASIPLRRAFLASSSKIIRFAIFISPFKNFYNYSITAKASLIERILYSVPSTFTSVPEYLA